MDTKLERIKQVVERGYSLSTKNSTYLLERIEEQATTIELLRDLYKYNFEAVERFGNALEEITRQYDDTSVNRAKEIAKQVLETE